MNHLNHLTADQRGSEFIDGVALEEYADEQDDYAQEREIEACIKAVDVDCDGKIGQSLPPSPGLSVVSCRCHDGWGDHAKLQ